MVMKQGSIRWFRTARGAAGVYAAAVPGLLLLMAMEPTPGLLQNTAWLLAIAGLVVFLGVFYRLLFLSEADGAEDDPFHRRMQRTFVFFGWLNLFVFVMCGLIWIYPEHSQCLIQDWVLGLAVAEGCK